MEGKSEQLDQCMPRSAADRKRKLVLYASASLILLTLCLAIVFRSRLNCPWLIVGALLLPVTQSIVGIAFFDRIRSSILLYDDSSAVAPLSMIVPMLTSILTCAPPQESHEVTFVLGCVYLLCGGMFGVGLGLANRFRYTPFYYIVAIFPVGSMVRDDGLVRAWLFLIPFVIELGMMQWRKVSARAV